jgi:hypothetical protein
MLLLYRKSDAIAKTEQHKRNLLNLDAISQLLYDTSHTAIQEEPLMPKHMTPTHQVAYYVQQGNKRHKEGKSIEDFSLQDGEFPENCCLKGYLYDPYFCVLTLSFRSEESRPCEYFGVSQETVNALIAAAESAEEYFNESVRDYFDFSYCNPVPATIAS